MSVQTFWFVVKTKPHRERYALRNIKRTGIPLEAFFPTLEGRNGKEEIVFPGFVFVKTYGQWIFLESTYGCASVVKFGENPGIVPHKVMAKLRKDIKAENKARRPVYKYASGQRLDIVHGQFRGISGTYSHTTPEKRIAILMSLLGRMVTVEQDAENVKAAA